MFYAFSYTPDADDTAENPAEIELRLTAGIIHQVDILFQDGCVHQVFAQVWHAGVQLWPSNRGEKLRGNATVISFREFYQLFPGDTILTLKIWTTLTEDFPEIILQIGLLSKRVLQPLSFDELLSAAMGIPE